MGEYENATDINLSSIPTSDATEAIERLNTLAKPGCGQELHVCSDGKIYWDHYEGERTPTTIQYDTRYRILTITVSDITNVVINKVTHC